MKQELEWLKGKSIKDVIDYHAKKQPQKIFAVEPKNEVITYGQLKKECQGVAEEIRKGGHKKGEAIAYATHNGTDAIRVILGAIYGGFVTTAINLVAGKETIKYVIGHSKTKVIFAQEVTRDIVRGGVNPKKTEIKIIQKSSGAKAKTNAKGGFNPKPNSHALLMYTSGTTGKPKGVVHTHKSIIAGGKNTAVAHQLRKEDVGLCTLPLYHINAFCVSLIGTLVSGGTIIIPDKFSVNEFENLISEYKCSWCSLVPTQIAYLLHNKKQKKSSNKKIKTIRFMRSASAPLAPDVQQEFQKVFGVPIIETMGLTETAAQILSNPIKGVQKIGSPGIAFGNKVIVADGNQKKIKHGQEGEIIVKGDNVMSHYKDNKKETNKTITKNKWLRTGDLGRMDEDGYIFVTGRLKELIIKGGENIAPREIDEALYSHPDVIEAAAFPRKCKQYGEEVEAAVVVDKKSKLNQKKLKALCEEKIGKWKTPKKIHFLEELPKGPSGKIQRLKVAEMTQGS